MSGSSGRAAASKVPSKSKEKVQKRTPKQPLPVSERLKRLFTSLCAQIDGGHFSNAVKTCDKILKLEPGDADALQTKLFLLLQTEQYDASLALIEANDDKVSHEFERAYSLYRKQREPEAQKVLNAIKAEKGDDDRGALHLEAQFNYRVGSYHVALDLYNQLLDTAEPGSEEQSDILTNLQASQQHVDFIDKGFLHALDGLPISISSTIESAPPPTQSTSSAAALASTVADAQPAAKPPVKKVRMSRVPAGVVPGVTPPPDPERWLKKSERSTFGQGRRRKGAGSGGGATQGSAAVETAGASAAGQPSKSGGGKGKKRK